ncbi:MAG: hypothetical protein OXT67_11965 [Zetaproteobacteria bacterium]|nr:hypothetical protein [Zetaproteobacteria bacterium]
MRKCFLAVVMSFCFTYVPGAYGVDPASVAGRVSTHALDEEPLHQLLQSLAQDPDSCLAYLPPEISALIADRAQAYWTFQHNQQRWVKSALQAAEQRQESEHLVEIAVVEEELFRAVLKAREAQLTTPEAWKRHAVAMLLTYSGIREAILDAMLHSTGHVISNALPGADGDVGGEYEDDSDGEWEVVTPLDIALDAAGGVALRAVLNVAWSAVIQVAGNILVLEEELLGAVRQVAVNAAKNAIGQVPQDTATNRVNPYMDADKIGKVAYRVAETSVWLACLDVDKQLLHKVYAAVDASLGQHFELQHWFGSKDHFHQQINLHLADRIQNRRAWELLQPLVQYLHRVGDKIFTQESAPQV